MNDNEPQDDAEELMEIVFNDDEFDEWADAGMIMSTDEFPAIDVGPDTEGDLPVIPPP